MADFEPTYRIAVEMYHAMVRHGIFDHPDGMDMELLSGVLVQKMSKDPIHSVVTGVLGELLRANLPSGWFVNAGEPITTADSEPEPDLSIVRGVRHDYLGAHPTPDQLAVVIEVANTSLARDRGIKLEIYAAAKCPIYWIVDTTTATVEVFAEPADGAATYAKRAVFVRGQRIPVIVDGQTIADILVDDLFPARP